MLRARSHPYRQSIRVLPRPRLVFSSEPRQRGPILKAVHARGVAYEVVRRVFEEDAYADRAFRSQAEGLDERDRAFAHAARLRDGAARPCARLRDRDARAPACAKARPARAHGAPARRVPARLPGVGPAHAAANESVELVRAAGLERAVAFTNAVMRRLAEGRQLARARCPRASAEALVPDWVASVWRATPAQDWRWR